MGISGKNAYVGRRRVVVLLVSSLFAASCSAGHHAASTRSGEVLTVVMRRNASGGQTLAVYERLSRDASVLNATLAGTSTQQESTHIFTSAPPSSSASSTGTFRASLRPSADASAEERQYSDLPGVVSVSLSHP
jgi:hypothetical protein